MHLYFIDISQLSFFKQSCSTNNCLTKNVHVKYYDMIIFAQTSSNTKNRLGTQMTVHIWSQTTITGITKLTVNIVIPAPLIRLINIRSAMHNLALNVAV